MCLASIVMTEASCLVSSISPRQPPKRAFQAARRSIARGQSEHIARNYFSDSGGRFFAGIWESTPGRWRVRLHENEFCHSARPHPHRRLGRSAVELQSRRLLRHSAGFAGTWEVLEPTAKLYVIYEARCFLVRR